MATYAIGDVQGCFDSLTALLERLELSDDDRLWLVGDLVNRGPASLAVLRWARDQGDRATVVLGNHDLHLLSAAVDASNCKGRDTLGEILAAPDRDELIDWLRHRPLLHRDGDFVMVHAGLHPAWTIDRAAELAREVEAALRADDWAERVRNLRGSKAPPWRDDLVGDERFRSLLSYFVKVRTCSEAGIVSDHTGPPSQAPSGFRPWFDHRHDDITILFGHWAMLGLHLSEHAIGLDSGCVWGRALTAIRIEDRILFEQPAVEG